MPGQVSLAYLKARGLYDESIIVVASDHGDATGEFGRYSHSTSIFPEVMRVPLIVHLPADHARPSWCTTTTDFPHSPTSRRRSTTCWDIGRSGRILCSDVRCSPKPGKNWIAYRRTELFLASDERAVYGLLADNGRFLYTTYDSPAESFLFDLSQDPNARAQSSDRTVAGGICSADHRASAHGGGFLRVQTGSGIVAGG